MVLTCDGDILLRKTKEPSLDDINEAVSKVVEDEGIDVDKLVAEAIVWARKQK